MLCVSVKTTSIYSGVDISKYSHTTVNKTLTKIVTHVYIAHKDDEKQSKVGCDEQTEGSHEGCHKSSKNTAALSARAGQPTVAEWRFTL